MYLDCYFIENLLINYIIINCVIYISRIYTIIYRRLLGAGIGAIYSVIYLYKRDSLIFTIPGKFIFIIIIVFIAFQIKNRSQFIKVIMYFYLVNVFISGSIYFTIYFTGITHTTASILIICTYISCKLLKITVDNIKKLKNIETLEKDISISVLDKKISCRALLDSGNLLKDPISKADVVVVKANLMKDLFKENFDLEELDLSNTQEIVDILEQNILNRVRLIPYKHAGNKDVNTLVGIRADYIEVDERKISNIIIAISNFDDNTYSAILNPRILY